MPPTSTAPRPDAAPDPAAAPPGWAALFAAVPVAILLVDPAGRVARANPPAEQLLRASERLMLGRPLSDLLEAPAADDGHDLAVYDAEVGTRGGTVRVDLNESHVADHPGWRVVTLHAGPPAHLSGRAPAGRAAVGAAALLAHEIKNPLSGIRGAAQLIGRGEFSDLIVREVDRIAALVDRMQGFTDDRPLPLGAENIYPVLAHARGVARAGFAAHVAIEERYDPSLPFALANRDALIQVLLNLLKNAAEAVADVAEPRIVLATAYRHGLAARMGRDRPPVPLPIEIRVVDNGPGAPPDLAGQMFEPFVSGRPGGTGLGLALVDKLVRDMGGLVQYAREDGRTVLRLLLPRAGR